MSLSRQLLREFRPLFRMLEEPIARPGPSSYLGLNYPFGRSSLFESFNSTPPAIDVTEEGDKYVVEAELPGVKKENIEVRIGDAGRSVTVEGKVVETRKQPQVIDMSSTNDSDTAVTGSDESGNQISTERTFVGNSSFRRTVWLPRPVDSNNVTANLDHGVLTITVNKAEDSASVIVPIQ